MASRILIQRRRGTKREGVYTLIGGLGTAVGLVAGIHLFPFGLFPFEPIRTTDPVFYFIFVGLAATIGGLIVVLYAVPNLLMDREFSFTLYEDRVECRSPASAFGESYTIRINDIAMLEENAHSEGASDWSFVTHDNRRIKITPNYGNPVREIVRALRRLRPDLPVIET